MIQLKNYIMDIEEAIFGLDFETIVENYPKDVAIMRVIEQLKLTSPFDKDIAKDIVTENYVAYWN